MWLRDADALPHAGTAKRRGRPHDDRSKEWSRLPYGGNDSRVGRFCTRTAASRRAYGRCMVTDGGAAPGDASRRGSMRSGDQRSLHENDSNREERRLVADAPHAQVVLPGRGSGNHVPPASDMRAGRSAIGPCAGYPGFRVSTTSSEKSRTPRIALKSSASPV